MLVVAATRGNWQCKSNLICAECFCSMWQPLLQSWQLFRDHRSGMLLLPSMAAAIATGQVPLTWLLGCGSATLFAAIRLALAAGPQNFELLRRRLQTCAGFQFVVVIKGRTDLDGHANNVYKHSCCCCLGLSKTRTLHCCNCNGCMCRSSDFYKPERMATLFLPPRIVCSFWANAKICDPDIPVCDTLNPPAHQTGLGSPLQGLAKELAYKQTQTNQWPEVPLMKMRSWLELHVEKRSKVISLILI